jgi:histidyl-tRNA synthetase
MSEKRQLIQPRTLKGFRDYLPTAAIPREAMMETARGVFRTYGFVPIDTPALEYEEILTGKGGEESDKQMFRFEDAGGRKVAMRFDLTVPLARFVAQYAGELGTPFKRYHIGPVWRGENPQRGRYREFLQCDFDTVGTTSMTADIETALVIHDLLVALDVGDFTIHLNNRKVLSGLLERLGLSERSAAVLRALDKLAKIGPEKVTAELQKTAEATEEQCTQVLAFAALKGDTDEVIAQLEPLVAGSEIGERGVAELRELFSGLAAAGVGTDRARLDVSIARGLDYYTGTVYETFLDELPEIGSISSGGRYDELANLYTKQELPGVGASLGLDRLFGALEHLGKLPTRATTARVLVPFFAKDRRDDYLRLVTALRREGLAVEFYPDPKKLGAQLKYADKRGHELALILGDDEWQSGKAQAKLLATGESRELPLEPAAALAAGLRELLG